MGIRPNIAVVSGQLSCVSATLDYGGVSAIKSDPIYLGDLATNGNFAIWSHIKGDLGQSSGSLYITYECAPRQSGATFTTPINAIKIRTAGTSISGTSGTEYKTFSPDISPWIKLKAIHNSKDTTNACNVFWALIYN